MKNVMLLIMLLYVGVFAIFHDRARTSQVHTPFRWVFADSTARNAESVTENDTDKVAYQMSDSSMWVLRDNDPKTWIQLSRERKLDLDSISARSVSASGTVEADSVYTRVVEADSLKAGSMFFKCDSGNFPCTLALFTGSYMGTDSIGTAKWVRQGRSICMWIKDITIQLVSASVRIKSFPDSLNVSGTDGYRRTVPIGFRDGQVGTVTFGYDIEQGAGTDNEVLIQVGTGNLVWSRGSFMYNVDY